MMWPVWYERRKKAELSLWGVGFIVCMIGAFQARPLVGLFGFLIMFTIMPLQHIRFRRMKKLEEDVLRCECGGHFVPPWDLGFDAPADHLICDNDKGLGPLGACTNWIVAPPDYPSSCQRKIE